MAHYRNGTSYLGQYSDGATPPEGAVDCPAPTHASQRWDGAKWVEVPPPAPTADQVRTTRNGLLASSDWTQVADAPVDQGAWATYRQALRDVTDQVGFPENVTWPVSPE